jgi:hypothetical protein
MMNSEDRMVWASRSDEQRRRHVGEFIAITPTMEQAMGVFRRCYRAWHEDQQASCSFVVGETGVGKTTAANEFLEEVRDEYLGNLKDDHNLLLADNADYPHTMSVTFEKPGHGLVRPVLKVFVGKKTTFKQLFADTLTAIGVRIPNGASLGEMKSVARQQITEQGKGSFTSVRSWCANTTGQVDHQNPCDEATMWTGCEWIGYFHGMGACLSALAHNQKSAEAAKRTIDQKVGQLGSLVDVLT